jgi:hypothetical protein
MKNWLKKNWPSVVGWGLCAVTVGFLIFGSVVVINEDSRAAIKACDDAAKVVGASDHRGTRSSCILIKDGKIAEMK